MRCKIHEPGYSPFPTVIHVDHSRSYTVGRAIPDYVTLLTTFAQNVVPPVYMVIAPAVD